MAVSGGLAINDLFTATVGPFTIEAGREMRVTVIVDGVKHHLTYEQVEALGLSLNQALDKASYYGTQRQLRHPDAPQRTYEVDRNP